MKVGATEAGAVAEGARPQPPPTDDGRTICVRPSEDKMTPAKSCLFLVFCLSHIINHTHCDARAVCLLWHRLTGGI